MRKIIAAALIILIAIASPLIAQTPETYEEIKTLSAQLSKPILLEFFRDD